MISLDKDLTCPSLQNMHARLIHGYQIISWLDTYLNRGMTPSTFPINVLTALKGSHFLIFYKSLCCGINIMEKKVLSYFVKFTFRITDVNPSPVGLF